MGAAEAIRQDALSASLDKRQRRLWAAAECRALGRGGVSLDSRVTGIARRMIHEGLGELKRALATVQPERDTGRVCKAGSGRGKAVTNDPVFLQGLEKVVDPSMRGDPESPLRWMCKSPRKLSEELKRQRHQVSHTRVRELTRELKYSPQARKDVRPTWTATRSSNTSTRRSRGFLSSASQRSQST